MELKANDNITILIEWKNKQNNEYITKTRTIANEFDNSAKTGPRSLSQTIIKMEIPHRELTNYVGMEDDEHAYDFDIVYRLIARLKSDDDVQAIFVERSKSEKAGFCFAYENIPYNIVKCDDEGNPTLIRLFPYVADK